MGRGKRTWFTLGLAAAFMLFGCGREESTRLVYPEAVSIGEESQKESGGNGQPETGRMETGQEDAVSWQDTRTALAHRYDGAIVKDGILYGYYGEGGGTKVVSQRAQTGEILKETTIADMAEVGSIAADAQGDVYVAGEGTLRRISADGQVTAFDGFVLEDLEEAFSVSPKGIYVDGDGHFFLRYEMGLPARDFYEDEQEDVYSMADRIYVKDSQMNTLFYVQIPSSRGNALMAFSVGESGTPMVLARDSEGVYIAGLDMEKQGLGAERRLDDMDWTEMEKTGFSDTGFLFFRGNQICHYDYDRQTESLLLNLPAYGILADTVLYLGLDGGKLEIVDSYSGTENSEYVALTEGESERSEITLGVVLSWEELEKAVAAYNRFSQKGRVRILEYDRDGDFERGLEQLKLDVVSGKCPDVIEVSNLNGDVFSAKGVFADLYGFMDSDAAFGRETLLEPVRKAYETDGHLYSCGPAFQIHTIWGAEDFVQGRSGISIGELMQMLEGRGKDINAVYGFSADEPVLTTLCTFAMDEFIDWDRGECDFSNEYMKGLLDFAAAYTGYGEGSLRQWISEGKILLTIGRIGSVGNYQIQKELYGGGVSFVGYPTVERTGTALSLLGGELAVSALGDRQEIAWDFVKFYMQNGYDGQAFPTVKGNFDLCMQQAMQDTFADTMEGSYKEAKDYFQDGSGGYIEVYAASQAEVDEVIRLIESAEKRYEYSVEIQNIINEEAESYFSGQKDFAAMADVLESRVGIYLGEQ